MKKEKTITAPFSAKQVKNMNEYQQAGRGHPFTCNATCGRRKPLTATKDGWICPCGEYKQDWTWVPMTKRQSNTRKFKVLGWQIEITKLKSKAAETTVNKKVEVPQKQ